MNLEYAAYLLNENYLLAEDADSDGIKYAKKWVTKNFNLTDFGQNATDPVLDDEGNPVVVNQQTQDDQGNPTTVQRNVPNVEDIVENARKYFGYWMSKQMNLPEHVRLGILKFLPGAIRIAINDCGWNTPHKNLRMLENLRYLYTAAYLEWRDGIAEGRPGPQRGQQYAGKYNRDFNGLSYTQLMNELGDKIQPTKERIAQIRRDAGLQGDLASDEELEEHPQEEQMTTNSPYHIELIENFNQSHQWFEYTNPTADQHDNHFAGARWCIAEYADQWRYYQNMYNNQVTVYYCWKAPSKQALLAMNDHVADYDTEDLDQVPFSEYGLSLICVMVQPGRRPGEVKFLQATSRYNHCDGHGEERFDRNPHSRYFGDHLCRDGGKAKICEILGMTTREFDHFLKPMNGGNGSVNHDNVLSHLDSVESVCHAVDDYDSFEQYGIYRLNHQGQYNYYDMYTKNLLSPSQWFYRADGFIDPGIAMVRFFNNKCNIINVDGELLLDVNADEINFSSNGKYAKVAIRHGDDYYYNIVRTDNGRPLLRKLYKDVFLADNYGVSIPVLDNDNRWKLLDTKGKVIGLVPGDMNIIKSTKSLLMYRSQSRSNVYKIVSKKTNREIFKYTSGLSNIVAMNDGNIVLKNSSGRYNIITENGPVFTSWINSISYGDERGKIGYYRYENRGKVGFVKSDGSKFELPNDVDYNYDKYGLIRASNKFYSYDGTEIDMHGYTNIYASSNNGILIMSKPDEADFKIFNTKTKEFTDVGDKKIVYIDHNNHCWTIKTSDNKVNAVDDTDGSLILNEFLPRVQVIYDIGQNCYIVKKGDRQYNIYNRDFNEMLFDMDFTELTTRFTQNGLAQIRCGRKNFIINTNGDVSTRIETIQENVRIFNGTENFLTETVRTRRVRRPSRMFENAAYLLD